MRSFGYRTLLWKTIVHHGLANLAIVGGCFAGASALIGALFVGDSMRGSMQALTLERLGEIRSVSIGSRLFGQDLAARLGRDIVPAILIQAAAENPATESTLRADVVGCDERFAKLFSGGSPLPSDGAAINRSLAERLGLKLKDRLLVKVEKPTQVPREALLGDRGADRSLKSIEFAVAAILDDRALGRFGLETTQRLPRNVFVPLAALQAALEAPGQCNALLDPSDPPPSQDDLKKSLLISDFGLATRGEPKFGYVAVESRRQVLEDEAVAAIERAAAELDARRAPTMAYLANSIVANGKSVPYSVVVACDIDAGGPFGELAQAAKLTTLTGDDVLLSAWTAGQLSARVGDRVQLEYFAPGADGGLRTESRSFRLAGVIPMSGLALDCGFVPPFKGITDAKTFANWEAPFPMDLKRVRKVDEDYWKQYRTSPKAFVSYQRGVELWGSRFGKATAIRAVPANRPIDEFAKELEGRLAQSLNPADFGFQFRPVRAMALAASSGSTDFGQLFVAFSFFTIVAAALLVGLLFRLNVERRGAEIGLQLAVGLPMPAVWRLLLEEGLLLAGIGAALGVGGAIVYAKWTIAMLTSRWQSAVGLPFIDFHGTAASAAVGALAAMLVACLAMLWAVRRLGRASAPQLMRGAGWSGQNTATGSSRWTIAAAILATAAGLVLVAAGALGSAPSATFFGSGAALLLAGLLWLAALVRSPRRPLRGRGWRVLAKLSARNAARLPARTMLTASMVGFAVFLVVALGLLAKNPHDVDTGKQSGTGGFVMVAETSSPVVGNLNTRDGRFQIGIADNAAAALDRFRVFAFRAKPGDDASCLNVYQPTNPTLLAAPAEFVERGGFAFVKTIPVNDAEAANPWQLLDRRFDDGAIPAIGDQNSLQWILKVPVGNDFEVNGDRDNNVKLRIVGGLSGSVFQGQLLISEANFVKAFPDRIGARYFLFEKRGESEADTSATAGLATALNRELAGYGVDVQSTVERIRSFAAVEQTYMSAFKTLGGIGLLLGTIGLGAVLARNVLERRGELALLAALGYSKQQLNWLALAEAIFVLAAGISIGAVAALFAAGPAAAHSASNAVSDVLAMLAIVFATGLFACLLALAMSMRGQLMSAIRGD